MSSPPPAIIDKDDLWFLEVVAEFGTPLYMLLLPDVAEALNMRRAHGLSFEALCEKLASLSVRDLIQIRQSPEGGAGGAHPRGNRASIGWEQVT